MQSVPYTAAAVRVPLFAGRGSIEPLLPKIAERQRAVLGSGRYILGPEVQAFEAAFAEYIGVRHCVGVGSGTDALTIALRALGVGAGDDVVVPATTFYATAEAVVNAGARPVFADVDPRTWCLTAATVEPALTEKTVAIVPVHLFGNPAPVPELAEFVRRRGGPRIVILEDAAQAAGARLGGRMAGSLGDAAAFSFYPSKNLAAFGDAGAIVTDDPSVAKSCRELRSHGSVDKRLHVAVGYSSRLDELQATALRVLLPRLDDWTRARREVAATYRRLGLGELVQLPSETAEAESCYHVYVVATPIRDLLVSGLREQGIESRVYYSTPVHRQPGMAPYAPGRPLAGAERLAREGLAIPMGPALREGQAEVVVEAAKDILTTP